MAPSVTVVIPTHNRPQLMPRAVASVISQDYEGDIEVIVVFDACDQVDPQIAERPNRRVVLIDNYRQRGLAGARNSGILKANHDLVAFLDDDDHWYPGKLRRQIEVMSRTPDAVMAVTGMDIDNGATIVHRPLPDQAITVADLTRDRIAAAHSGSFLFTREALQGSLGLVDEELPGAFGEDYDLLLRAARIAPIAVVPEPQVCITWQGQSLFAKKWATIAEALQYMLDKHPEFAADPKGRARLEAQIAMAYAGVGDHKDARAWVRRALKDNPADRRAWAAVPVSLHLVGPNTLLRIANRFGRGI